MPIMNQIETGKQKKGPNSNKVLNKKQFYSLNDKIKSYILSQNYSQVLDRYVKNLEGQEGMDVVTK
jgi:DNA-binding protein Fis